MSHPNYDITGYALSSVNAYQSFPTVDELLAAVTEIRPDAISPIGVSRRGEPLLRLSIGTGDRHAVIVAGSHANEPIGFHTVIALARLVAGTPELNDGWTWHFVPCLDPDSARLNRWYTSSLAVDDYHRWMYRPQEQPSWGLSEEPALSEAAALKRLIDEVQPRFVIDLHNADLSGAYFVVNPDRCTHALAGELVAAVQRFDVPLQTEPGEAHGWDSVEPGVVVIPPLPHYGVSLYEYAGRHGALVVAPEVPLWSVDLRLPPEPGCPSRHRLCAEAGSAAAVVGFQLARVTHQLTVQSPFKAAAEMYVPGLREIEARARDWDGHPTAEQYVATLATVIKMRQRAVGMILRLLDDMGATGSVSPREIARLRADTEDLFAWWHADMERRLSPRPVPLENGVSVQIATALAAKRHVEQ
jgi:hypothetical protein